MGLRVVLPFSLTELASPNGPGSPARKRGRAGAGLHWPQGVEMVWAALGSALPRPLLSWLQPRSFACILSRFALLRDSYGACTQEPAHDTGVLQRVPCATLEQLTFTL